MLLNVASAVSQQMRPPQMQFADEQNVRLAETLARTDTSALSEEDAGKIVAQIEETKTAPLIEFRAAFGKEIFDTPETAPQAEAERVSAPSPSEDEKSGVLDEEAVSPLSETLTAMKELNTSGGSLTALFEQLAEAGVTLTNPIVDVYV